MLIAILILIGLVFAEVPVEYKLLKKFKEKKDVATALFLLGNYPNAVFVDELRVELADLLVKKGELERAKKIIYPVDLKNLRDEYGEKVSKLWRLLDLDPRKLVLRFPEHSTDLLEKVELSDEERRGVLRRLLLKRKYRDVLRFAEDDCLLKGIALQRLKRWKESLEILQGCEDEADLYILKALLNIGDVEKAEAFSRERDTEEVYFHLGWYFLSERDYKRARRYFLYSGKSYRGLFYAALVDYIRGKYKLSYETLSEAERYAKGNMERSQVYFWKYRVLTKMGFPKLAKYYLKLSSQGVGFYAAVSRKMLGERVWEDIDLNFREGSGSELARMLTGIKELGFLYYMRLEAFKRLRDFTPEDVLAISKVDPYAGIKIAIRLFGGNSEIYRAIAYPTPFREIVKEVSKKFKVEPALIYAIMRQESLFDPIAISRADAKGLMQLLDRTAVWIANRIGHNLNDIFDVRTNITLGIAYLRFLIDHWKGDMLRAIASYNAGQGAVKKWNTYQDDFLFIETIPYRETREYVKRVLWFYYIYSEKLLEKAF